MKEVKSVEDCTIYQKRSGRYAVKCKDKKYLNAEDKVEVLVKAGLIEKSVAKTVESEEPAEDTPAEGEGSEE